MRCHGRHRVGARPGRAQPRAGRLLELAEESRRRALPATAVGPSSATPSPSPAKTPTPSPTATHLPPLTTRPARPGRPCTSRRPARPHSARGRGSATCRPAAQTHRRPAGDPRPARTIPGAGGDRLPRRQPERRAGARLHRARSGGRGRGFIVATPNGTNGLWNFSGTEPLPDDAAFTQDIATLLAFAGLLERPGLHRRDQRRRRHGCRRRLPGAGGTRGFRGRPEHHSARRLHEEAVSRGARHGRPDRSLLRQCRTEASPTSRPSRSRRGCRSGPPAAADRRRGLAAAPGRSVQRWGCAAGRTVQLYTVDGGGHTWPGAVGPEPAAGLGARASWSADSVALDFFLDE